MASRNRLVAYILLNVLVSAFVTLTILILYHQSFRPAPLPGVTAGSGAGGGARSLEITRVAGVGRLESEAVAVHNAGPASVDLAGWSLQSPDGAESYVFPEIILHPDGALRVHTGPGGDTAIDLFWNRSRAAWRSGDLISLVDANGLAVDNFLVP